MKKLALLLLLLPLAACATAQQNQPEAPHVFVSHWDMTNRIYNGFNSAGLASASSGNSNASGPGAVVPGSGGK